MILPPIPLTLNRPANQFYRTYLNLIIAAAGEKISDQEREILEECFLIGRGEFDAETRKEICERLGTSVPNLNNYIKKLRDKKYIDEENRLSATLNMVRLRIPESVTEDVSITIPFTITNKQSNG